MSEVDTQAGTETGSIGTELAGLIAGVLTWLCT
jgi:hypothetical protein